MNKPNMKVSTSGKKDATTVELIWPEPTTVDDPQWKKWGLAEADICGKASRTVRIDAVNGKIRPELVKAVRRGLKGKELQKYMQGLVDAWTSEGSAGKVIDLRGVPNMQPEQIEAIRRENPGATLILK